jgi:hypothetical protein
LVNVFIADAGGVDYFVQMGYTKEFHRVIMTAEVLGGAALLLPWRWLTLTAAFGLTVDMFGALYTQARAGDPLDAAAFAMLLRLGPLVLLTLGIRWAHFRYCRGRECHCGDRGRYDASPSDLAIRSRAIRACRPSSTESRNRGVVRG